MNSLKTKETTMASKVRKSGAAGLVLAALLTAGGGCVAGAQEAAKPEPEYFGTVYRYDAAANKLNPLQRQKLTLASKTKALGFGGMKGVYQTDSPRSDVRFTAGQGLEFVLQASPSLDPQSQIELVRFNVKGKHRELIMAESGPIFGGYIGKGGVHQVDKYHVPFQAKKYSASSIEISPAEPLQPGEYAARSPNALDVFCFGIDPPAAQ
jgi:hypothetical protein